MKTFEDKLHESTQRIAAKENRQMRVPQNPLKQKAIYWGWVATPAAAVVGVVLGLSAHLAMDKEPEIRYVHETDTLRLVHPVHDTLYLTQIVEKERYVVRPASPEPIQPEPMQDDEEAQACTSVQCDGINYAILASN